jgi:predicted RNA polymerase sigma factor
VIRLAPLLVEHPVGAVPETDALLALMYLDSARFDARVDGAGSRFLLEDQDRSLGALLERRLDASAH